MKSIVILLISFAIAISAIAETPQVTKLIASETVTTQDKNTATQLSEQEKALAKRWMLTDSDWIKYKQIMSGPRGIWTPGIDPITALGVEETDQAQRKRYAEIWLKVESRRAELELAFELERSIAAKKIFPDKQVVNNSSWVSEWTKKKDSVRKIVHMFVDVMCMEKCKDHFNQIHGSIGNNAQLDIYFRDGATSDQIGKWAAFMGISPDVVKSRKITLNFDGGKSSKLGVDMSKLPVVKVLDVRTGKVAAMGK